MHEYNTNKTRLYKKLLENFKKYEFDKKNK